MRVNRTSRMYKGRAIKQVPKLMTEYIDYIDVIFYVLVIGAVGLWLWQ